MPYGMLDMDFLLCIMNINIKKNNGKKEQANLEKLRILIEIACKDLQDVDAESLIKEVSSQLFDGIPSKQIYEALILSARSKIVDEDPNYSYVAARLLLIKLYKEVFGRSIKHTELNEVYPVKFIENTKILIEQGLLNKELLNFDLDLLAKHIRPERDLLLEYPGIQTLYDRYFIHIKNHRMEAPQTFFMRVAMGLSLNETNKEEWSIKFYDKISLFKYLPSTPTLFNSGTNHSQLSSCYLSTVDDSIDGIFGTIHGQALLSKYAGGLAVDWTPIRAIGSWIKGTNGPSQGLIPWLKIFNDTLIAVNQGSKRKGSGCSYLECWHYEFEEFLELKKNTGDERRRCHDMNTAGWIPDYFMRQVEADGLWYLMSPDEVGDLHDLYGEAFDKRYEEYVKKGLKGELLLFKQIKAKTLWKKWLSVLPETGHPWVCFKDPSNIRYTDKHEGVVHSSNLCTEVLRHTKPSKYEGQMLKEIGETAVCNLAALNLATHIKNGTINLEELHETVEISIRGLDNVIDLNYYPTLEAKKSNLRHRPVGLGIMGWHDLLNINHTEFDSERAVNFAKLIQEHICYSAVKASVELAKERGKYESFEGSEWSKGKLTFDTYKDLCDSRGFICEEKGDIHLNHWKKIKEDLAEYGIRNSNLTLIQPTATISYIAGCSQSIEPNYSVLFTYSTLSGQLPIINKYFIQRLKNLGLWNKKILKQIKRYDGDVTKLEIPEDLKREYKCCFDISYENLIKAAAGRQIWIDQGQSLNLYFNEKSLKKLNDMYMFAWKSLLKTTYYLRTKGASSVEKITTDKEKEAKSCSLENPNCESCQ